MAQNYLTGIERRGYADGSLYLPYTNFLNLLKGRTSGDFNEEGQYVPFNYQMYVRPEQDIFDIYNRPMYSGQLNAEQLYQRYLGQTPNEDFLNYINSFKDNIPTEDFSDYLNQSIDATSPDLEPGYEAVPVGPNLSNYVSSAPQQSIIDILAQRLFPQGRFQDIRRNAPSRFDYNVQATADLVNNLPRAFAPFYPAMAGIMSLPYDMIQAYQRRQNYPSFYQAYRAEQPLRSMLGRFMGAAAPLSGSFYENPTRSSGIMNAIRNPMLNFLRNVYNR